MVGTAATTDSVLSWYHVLRATEPNEPTVVPLVDGRLL